MTNAQIRKRAWHLYGKNFALLWGIFALIAPTTSFINWLSKRIAMPGIWSSLSYTAISLLLAPILVLGLLHVSLRLVQHKKASFSQLFDFCKSPRQLASSYIVLVLLNSPVVLLASITSHSADDISVMGASLVLIIFVTWMYSRLFLFPYLFVSKQDGTVWSQLTSSFRYMKGHVGATIWFSITAIYPFLIYFLLLIILIVARVLVFPTTSFISWYSVLLSWVPSIFLLPFSALSLAGYANLLLDDMHPKLSRRQLRRAASEARKANGPAE